MAALHENRRQLQKLRADREEVKTTCARAESTPLTRPRKEHEAVLILLAPGIVLWEIEGLAVSSLFAQGRERMI